MEEEINNSTGQASAATQQRPRPGQLSAVRHRPSRPSLLSEVSSENTTLGQLREVDDDEISATGSDQGVRLQNNALRNELVDTGHNSLLRQAAFENARMRQRAATGTTSFSGDLRFSIPTMSDAIAGAGTESAIDEGGDLTQPGEQSRILNRRFSEVAGPLPLFPEEPLRAEDTKRAHWQSSLDFGTIGEDTQSRRNSFAGIPTRRGSLVPAFGQESSTITPSFGGLGGPGYLASSGATEVPDMRESHQHPQLPTIAPQAIEKRYSENRAYARTYFSGVAPAVRSTLEMTAGPLPPYHPSGTYRHGPASSVFSRPGQDAPLYIVSFKCARADAFYVAEGTGLQVKEGDLVIVEADRGHDLGTVLHARVSWSRARELKEQAAEEHYRWLMMFSRHNQTIKSDTVNPNGMMASSSTRRGSMGVPETGHGSDLKPKMIKRLAQPHEIATLRDKEGNEAKAKRVCQQKVNEHRLSMEILDAEFQMDWKKLTFYYFAETYINFNSLVTDLFKIYKTRIWMSAINPASFASNALQPPSGVGPGALQGRDTPMDNSRPGLIGGIAPGQDPDPLGAIPPSQNPTTNSYQQLMLARQQFQQEQQARVYGQYSQANQMQPFTSTSATTATGQTPDSFNFGSIMTGSTNNGLASQSLQGQYGAQPSYGVSNTGYPLSMTAAMAPTMYGVNTPSPSSARAGPDATGPARNRPKPAKDSDWFARFSNLNLEPKKD
ncbi:hypothetical protein H2203_008030 [Taxawa tesnikishii (nom. ined.)]|nr:hypothetical protein H2203_008030 [Dothideales sp. JES 119]